MVDFESYFRYGPADWRVGSLASDEDWESSECLRCRTTQPCESGYRCRFDLEEYQHGSWVDEQYILCPPRVLGYVLSEKRWAQLQVSELTDIAEADPNDSWAKRLQLADGNATKDMIGNLVKSHKPSDETRDQDALEVDDIVANKGKGLVILLYGTTSYSCLV